MSAASEKMTLHCSFCGKSQHEVRRLVANPPAYICDECVDAAKVIIGAPEHGQTIIEPVGPLAFRQTPVRTPCPKCGSVESIHCNVFEETAGPLVISGSMIVDTSGWRPIESAPKDGTPIIGATFNAPWADSHLNGQISRCWFQPEFDAFISSCRQMCLAAGYTFEDGKTTQLHSPVIKRVDHWMPLPPPPESPTHPQTMGEE